MPLAESGGADSAAAALTVVLAVVGAFALLACVGGGWYCVSGLGKGRRGKFKRKGSGGNVDVMVAGTQPPLEMANLSRNGGGSGGGGDARAYLIPRSEVGISTSSFGLDFLRLRLLRWPVHFICTALPEHPVPIQLRLFNVLYLFKRGV